MPHKHNDLANAIIGFLLSLACTLKVIFSLYRFDTLLFGATGILFFLGSIYIFWRWWR